MVTNRLVGKVDTRMRRLGRVAACMSPGNAAVYHLLNNLIESCKDEQESFRVAAEDVHDPSLQSLLTEFAQRREVFSQELENCVPAPDRVVLKSINAVSLLHRSWVHFRIALAGNDEHAILMECERGEEHMLEEYRKALEKEWPTNVT